MRWMIEREKPDYVFHLGDHDRDADDLRREYQTLPIAGVRGNCDWHSDAPVTLTLALGGFRFFLCHGHTYGVKGDLLRAVYAAEEARADFLLFGHTHRQLLMEDGGLRTMNPGACGYEVQPTCGLLLLGPGRTCTASILNIKD